MRCDACFALRINTDFTKRRTKTKTWRSGLSGMKRKEKKKKQSEEFCARRKRGFVVGDFFVILVHDTCNWTYYSLTEYKFHERATKDSDIVSRESMWKKCNAYGQKSISSKIRLKLSHVGR